MIGDKLYEVDLEGHAVLIVGYDDKREAFLLADPWNRAWGGVHFSKRWLGYGEISMVTVDSSKGSGVILSPLQVDLEEVDLNGETALDLRIGFYAPQAIVMDWANQSVSRVTVALTDGRAVISTDIEGVWRVGEKASLRLTGVAALIGDLTLTVTAEICGERPYAYRDSVSVTRRCYAAEGKLRHTLVA